MAYGFFGFLRWPTLYLWSVYLLNKSTFTLRWLAFEFFPERHQGPSLDGAHPRDSPETWDLAILLPHFPETPFFAIKEGTRNGLQKHNAKICQETYLTWDEAIPVALLWIRVAPRSRFKLSPFKILYSRPFQVFYPGKKIFKCSKRPSSCQYAKTLGTILISFYEFASSRSAW